MNEDPPMCPICGGLHPAGHRDKEFEDLLETWKLGLRVAKMSGEARRVMEKVVKQLEETLQSPTPITRVRY